MSDAIPFQRSAEELKQLERQFDSRKPMLTHVAAAVKSELVELLEDEGYRVDLKTIVLSAKQFNQMVQHKSLHKPLTQLTSQIHIRIFSRGSHELDLIKDTIETHYRAVEAGWKEDRSQLTLKFLIPPQAKPDGYRDRDDVPNLMQVSIVASPSEPRMTTDGDEIPHLALIMKGGGIKGLAYVGALDLLRDQYDFEWFVGTSAGAITAILLAAGYSVEEMKDILKEKNFKDFFDAPFYKIPTNVIFRRGMHPAKEFTDWMDGLLTQKFGGKLPVTLGQIHNATGNRITVYASQKGRQALTFDSVDNADISAAYVARCSMSIPIVFTPQSEQGRWAFDGGLQNNFPIRQLTDDHGEVPFVSLYLGAEAYEPQKETSVIWHVLGILLGQGEDEIVDEHKDQTVVVDPRPIGTLDFDIDESEKSYLLTCGKIGALKHIYPKDDHAALPELGEAIQSKKTLQPAVDRMHRWRWWKSRIKWGAFSVLLFVALYLSARWWFTG